MRMSKTLERGYQIGYYRNVSAMVAIVPLKLCLFSALRVRERFDGTFYGNVLWEMTVRENKINSTIFIDRLPQIDRFLMNLRLCQTVISFQGTILG